VKAVTRQQGSSQFSVDILFAATLATYYDSQPGWGNNCNFLSCPRLVVDLNGKRVADCLSVCCVFCCPL